jgi:hypothetical protein
MFCSLAASGAIVSVPADGQFVCPQCGRTLVSPTARLPRRRKTRAVLRLGIAALLVAGFIGGMAIGTAFLRPWSDSGTPLPVAELPVDIPAVAVRPLRQPDPLSYDLPDPSAPHHRRTLHRHGGAP